MIIAVMVGACSPPPAPPAPASSPAAPGGVASEPAPAAGADDQVIVSGAGTYCVAFQPRAERLPLNEPFSMRVRVLDSAARPLSDAQITLSVDAAMPAHRHGMNTLPAVTARGDGSFQVDGMLLHMPGDWELYFDVTRRGVTERAQVAVTLE